MSLPPNWWMEKDVQPGHLVPQRSFTVNVIDNPFYGVPHSPRHVFLLRVMIPVLVTALGLLSAILITIA